MIKPELRVGVFLIKGEDLAKRLEDKYQEGYADGYNKALGKPAVQEGGTADRKEFVFVKREGKRNAKQL